MRIKQIKRRPSTALISAVVALAFIIFFDNFGLCENQNGIDERQGRPQEHEEPDAENNKHQSAERLGDYRETLHHQPTQDLHDGPVQIREQIIEAENNDLDGSSESRREVEVELGQPERGIHSEDQQEDIMDVGERRNTEDRRTIDVEEQIGTDTIYSTNNARDHIQLEETSDAAKSARNYESSQKNASDDLITANSESHESSREVLAPLVENSDLGDKELLQGGDEIYESGGSEEIGSPSQKPVTAETSEVEDFGTGSDRNSEESPLGQHIPSISESHIPVSESSNIVVEPEDQWGEGIEITEEEMVEAEVRDQSKFGHQIDEESIDPDHIDLDYPQHDNTMAESQNLSDSSHTQTSSDDTKTLESETETHTEELSQFSKSDLEADNVELDNDQGMAQSGSIGSEDLNRSRFDSYGPPVQDEVEEDGHNESAEEGLSPGESDQLQQGSLASFFEKVKGRQQNLSGDPDQSREKEQQTESSPETHHGQLEEATPTFNYAGTWGIPNRRYADLEILGLLFDKNLVDSAPSRYGKVFEPFDGLVIPSLYSSVMGGGDVGSTKAGVGDSAPSQDLKEKRSANSEFVEGLDDIDKFFEMVDPPDEFDVGAAGTSIQDVLMGQTSKIFIKKITLCALYISRTLKVVKIRVTAYFKNGGRKWPHLEREQAIKAGQWVVAKATLSFAKARDIFQSFFEDDEVEIEGLSVYANDLQKKLQDMTGPR